MQIEGLTKLSLLDYPEYLSCTVFTPGCQFRCPFCHNGQLAVSNPHWQAQFSVSEILSFLKKRIHILHAVCISGGEPLLQVGLKDFITAVKQMGYLVKLDTNGYRPEKLGDLLESKLLDYVAMDIKNCPSRYAETCGLQYINLDIISKSIQLLQNSNIPFEFRTTVVKEFHTAENIKQLSKWSIGKSILYLQSFQQSSKQIKPGLHAYSTQEMETLCQNTKDLIPGIRFRGMY